MPASSSSRPGRAATSWQLGLGVFAGWLVIGLISSSLTFNAWQGEGLQIGWSRTQLLLLPYWLYWAAVTPVIVALGKAWPLTGGRWRRTLPRHALAAITIGAVHILGYATLYKEIFPWPAAEPLGPPVSRLVTSMLASRFQFELLVYVCILGISLALVYAREVEARTVTAAQLEAKLAQAQLASMRMQLNPHFLFNTLQAVSVLVIEDPRRAQRMLTLLGDLLRAVFEEHSRQEVPLAEELGLLERYLEIEQTRFSDRLRVSFDIDPRANELLVPSFVLQPLVENAIRYAIAPRSGPGSIAVAARTGDHRLLITVTDDGPGPRDNFTDGVGLGTTRARLEKLYGGNQRFTLLRGPAGGAVASLDLPARPPARPNG
jgi:signal transduction histidine kinase